MTIRTMGVAAALLASATFVSAQSPKWHKDLNAAMKVAKKTKKPIMVDYYADW